MATRYWVAGSGNWSDAGTHWATETGGSAGTANLPTSSDDVFIDANSGFGSGGTITLDVDGNCNDFVANSGHTFTLTSGEYNYNLGIWGSLSLESGLTFYSGDGLYLWATAPGKTITVGGATIDSTVYIGGANGGWTLQDDLEITVQFYQENGTFDANDHNVTANDFYFSSETDYTPIVIMGSGTWEATGSGDVWLIDEVAEVVTITKETSTIKISNASATAKTFTGGGKTYNNVWFTGSGTGSFIITGSNTFNDFKVDTPPHTIKFQEGTTQTINGVPYLIGTSGNLITIDSVDGLTQHILSKSSGIVSCDYLDISNSNAIGGATWYAGSHSVDTTNNDGWIFTDAPTAGAILQPKKFW